MKKEKTKLKEQKFMFRFDNDEPVQICFVPEGQKVLLEIDKGKSIKFEKDGKKIELYFE